MRDIKRVFAKAVIVAGLILIPVSVSFAQEMPIAEADDTASDKAMNLKFKRVDGVNNSMEEAVSAAEQEKEAEEARKKLDQMSYDRAVEGTRNTLFPMRPEDIEKMLDVFNETRETAETSGNPIPKAEIKVADISLDPSVLPEIIKTAPGHVTSLTILDITGQPWPIQDVTWGGKFDIVPPEDGGHVIRITPSSAHGFGNMSIRLIDLPTPVTFSLQTSPDLSYYRFDARVPEYGPNSQIPIIDTARSIQAGDAVMTAVLDGAPPVSAKRLTVEGVDGRTSVWDVDGTIFVRTPLSLLSPGWVASTNSGDGMAVYKIKKTPVLLLSDRGNMVRAHIGKEEIIDDEQ